jgi:hypothetical protein
MVKADYDMKVIVDGADALPVPGFLSMMALMKKDIAAGVRTPRSMMNRYWFAKAVVWYQQVEDIVLFENFVPPLLTEEEYLSQKGKVEGKGNPNPYAHKVTQAFTSNYTSIAEAAARTRNNPIYLELENLYRWLALAQALKKESAFEAADLKINSLLNDFREEKTKVEHQLKGRVNEFSMTNEQTRHEFLSCGGVEMRVTLSRAEISARRRLALDEFKKDVLRGRSRGQLMWPIVSTVDLGPTFS